MPNLPISPDRAAAEKAFDAMTNDNGRTTMPSGRPLSGPLSEVLGPTENVGSIVEPVGLRPLGELMVEEDRRNLVRRIADAFADSLRKDLTPAEFAEMKRLNETPEYAVDICASADVLDSNMNMHAAFVEVLGREPKVVGEGPEVEAECQLWNDAWEDARNRHIGKPFKAEA